MVPGGQGGIVSSGKSETQMVKRLVKARPVSALAFEENIGKVICAAASMVGGVM